MRYVQVVLTDDHVHYLREGLKTLAVESDQADEVAYLETFMGAVADHPEYFPVKGHMARAIKSRMRKLKGPAQPPSGKRKRTQGRQRRDRAARRQEVADYNLARERVEADVREYLALQEERATRRVQLVTEPDLYTPEEIAELFELFDLPHIAAHIRQEREASVQR